MYMMKIINTCVVGFNCILQELLNPTVIPRGKASLQLTLYKHTSASGVNWTNEVKK